MKIEDEIRKTKAKLEQLEAMLQKEKRNKEYGGMALKIQDADSCAPASGDVSKVSNRSYFNKELNQGRMFTTSAAAERFSKAERLAFECRKAMAKSFGGEEIDWLNPNQIKYCLHLYDGNAIGIVESRMIYKPFHFKTRADAKKFIGGYSDQDIILMIKGGDV